MRKSLLFILIIGAYFIVSPVLASATLEDEAYVYSNTALDCPYCFGGPYFNRTLNRTPLNFTAVGIIISCADGLPCTDSEGKTALYRWARVNSRIITFNLSWRVYNIINGASPYGFADVDVNVTYVNWTDLEYLINNGNSNSYWNTSTQPGNYDNISNLDTSWGVGHLRFFLNNTAVDPERPYLKTYFGFLPGNDALPSDGTNGNTTIYRFKYESNDYTPDVVCNFTGAVQASGTIIPQSYFNVWDLTTGEMESFYLPYGVGSVGVPALGHTYAFNASKAGYGETDYFPVGGVEITDCEAWQAGPTFAHLIGPAVSATNTTLDFWVHDNSDYPLAVPDARILLDTGETGYTNNAGYASFDLLITGRNYEYDVTKTGYYSTSGNITLIEDREFVDVTLLSGAIPTATQTTVSPLEDHPSPERAATNVIQLIADFAYALAAIFLIAILIGGVKLIAK